MEPPKFQIECPFLLKKSMEIEYVGRAIFLSNVILPKSVVDARMFWVLRIHRLSLILAGSDNNLRSYSLKNPMVNCPTTKILKTFIKRNI